jgi:creatinine amidohydrolase/Fe(II)-dependent formamide hydrolase-like protein
MGTELTAAVSGLPVAGQTIYVRLHSLINGAWQFNDYTLTAVGGEEAEQADEEDAMAISNAATDTLVQAASDASPYDLWPVAVARREGLSLAAGLR